MSTSERFSVEPNPATAGMSTGKKVLIGCSIGCGVLGLLCAGAFVFLAWWGTNFLRSAMKSDPAEIRQLSENIAEIDVPADLQPKIGTDMKVPFTDMQVKMAIYASPDEEEMLGLIEIQAPDAEMDEAKFRQQMNDAIKKPGGSNDRAFTVRKTSTVDMNIRGEKVPVRIEEGTNSSGRELVRATGMFRGKAGAAFVFLQLDAKKLPSEDEIQKILQSIK